MVRFFQSRRHHHRDDGSASVCRNTWVAEQRDSYHIRILFDVFRAKHIERFSSLGKCVKLRNPVRSRDDNLAVLATPPLDPPLILTWILKCDHEFTTWSRQNGVLGSHSSRICLRLTLLLSRVMPPKCARRRPALTHGSRLHDRGQPTQYTVECSHATIASSSVQ